MRRRATILLPRTMLVAQPQIPVPLAVTFPYPAGATRLCESIRPPDKAREDFDV